MKTAFATLSALALVTSLGPSLPASAVEVSMADLAVRTVASVTADPNEFHCDVTVTNDPVGSGYGDDDTYGTTAIVMMPVEATIKSNYIEYESGLNCGGQNICTVSSASAPYVTCSLGHLARQGNASRNCAAVATIHVVTSGPIWPPQYVQTRSCGSFVYDDVHDSHLTNNYSQSVAP
jgi:hypothetical protein